MKLVNNHVEFEIISLKGTIELLDEILTSQLYNILGSSPDQNILFHTWYHQKYFYANLVDFLCPLDENFRYKNVTHSLFSVLIEVSNNPSLGKKEEITYLGENLQKFEKWLNTEKEIEHWYPDIDKQLVLKLSRRDMLRTCGNISKHVVVRLGRTTSELKKIFEKSKIQISYEEAFMSLDNFYERFHDDILNYHATYIVEMLLDIRRGINRYLLPVYADHYRSLPPSPSMPGINRYEFIIPSEIKGEALKAMFWNLMNNVRSRMNWPIPAVATTKYIKMRY